MAKQVTLDAKLDSAVAPDLGRRLIAAKDEDVALDGSQVEQLGALCLEVLMSARHLWSAAGHAFTLQAPSDRMVDDLARFGLTPEDFAGDAA